jgi:hypothetical protein
MHHRVDRQAELTTGTEPNRRGEGRTDDHDPDLAWDHAADDLPVTDPEDTDQLAASRGIVVWMLASVVFWLLLLGVLWALI